MVRDLRRESFITCIYIIHKLAEQNWKSEEKLETFHLFFSKVKWKDFFFLTKSFKYVNLKTFRNIEQHEDIPERHNVVVRVPLRRRYNGKTSKRIGGTLTVDFNRIDGSVLPGISYFLFLEDKAVGALDIRSIFTKNVMSKPVIQFILNYLHTFTPTSSARFN